MYYKLDNDELKRIEEISNITGIDYELKGNFIPVESLVCIAEDMLVEFETLEEKINDLRQDIENNYEIKQENPYIEYGVSERDFL